MEPIAILIWPVDYHINHFNMRCDKELYPTKLIAQEAINGIKKHRNLRKPPVRAYYCKSCDGWHLTSNSKKTIKIVMSRSKTLQTKTQKNPLNDGRLNIKIIS